MESMTFRAGILRLCRLRFTHLCDMISIEADRRHRGVPHGPERCRNAAFCLILQLASANKMTKMQGVLCAKRTGGSVQKLPGGRDNGRDDFEDRRHDVRDV